MKTEKASAADSSVNETTKKAGVTIQLPPLRTSDIVITLVGTSSLISHKFADKQRRIMLEKQMGKATSGREAKNPQADFESSIYRLPDGSCGFPATAFKSAAVSACTSLGKSISKVAARQSHHVLGDMVKIEGMQPVMREDTVRVGNKQADLRYRAEFKPGWRVRLKIRYNEAVLSAEQIVNLYNIAGFAVGVGEWRPEKSGQFGMFEVERSAKQS